MKIYLKNYSLYEIFYPKYKIILSINYLIVYTIYMLQKKNKKTTISKSICLTRFI